MKFNRTYSLVIVSSVALLMLLAIQVHWVLQTAKMKEALFNEKANMVLAKTAGALSADKQACQNLETSSGDAEKRKLDSLFNYYMKFYNIHINYYFEINTHVPTTFKIISINAPYNNGSYKACIDGDAPNKGLELKLIFPGKEQFILAEMRAPFITSVVLVIVLLFMFRSTIVSLIKEKKIASNTRDFLNNMTHEFKTPLTNIGLAGKMILKDANISEEEKVRHYSNIIIEENEKLKLQVEQVLNMAALEKGEIPLMKNAVDLHRLIDDVLRSFRIQIDDKQVEVKLDLTATNFTLNGDKLHLTNAIANLVDNAIKYSGNKPELSIRTLNRAQYVVIEVADNGIGIEKEYCHKVFDKFFRVPTGNIHNVKGFGIGLTYIKTIVEQHGGTIELRSEKGKGTTFIITLLYA